MPAPSDNASDAAPTSANINEDNSLIDCVRRGDKSAFEYIYRTYYEKLVESAYSYTRSRASAEEIVQDVFLRLWRNRAQWHVSHSITVYLYGAVRNGGVHYQRQNNVRERAAVNIIADEPIPGMSTTTPAPDASVHEQDIVRAILHVINNLSETVREAFLLRWHHKLSYAQIAQATGITESAAMMRVSRARAAIQEELDRLSK